MCVTELQVCIHCLSQPFFAQADCISLPQRSQSKADMSCFWQSPPPGAGPGERPDNTDEVSTGTPTKHRNLESLSAKINMSGEKPKRQQKQRTVSGKKTKSVKDANESSSGVGEKRPMQSREGKRAQCQGPRPPTAWRQFVTDNFASTPPGSFKNKMQYMSQLWKAKNRTMCEEANATDTGEGSVLNESAIEQ
jgi:hypothetical protein